MTVLHAPNVAVSNPYEPEIRPEVEAEAQRAEAAEAEVARLRALLAEKG